VIFWLLEKGKNLINEDSEFSIYSLFPYHDAHKLEILKIEIAPFSNLSNTGHMNGVDEYIYVIEGEIKMVLGETEMELYRGDSVRFKGEKSHKLMNHNDKVSYLLNIIIYN
jgi:XRE family transcriptional regulator, regulator of sulfur utilization